MQNLLKHLTKSLLRKLQAGSVQLYSKGDSGAVFFLRVLLLIAPVWKSALIGLFLLFLRGPRLDAKHALRFLRSTFLKNHDKQDMDNTNKRSVKTLKGAKVALKRSEISNLFFWEVREKIEKIRSAPLPNFSLEHLIVKWLIEWIKSKKIYLIIYFLIYTFS